MDRVKEIKLREIKWVSPSQFYSMKKCGYKSLLAEAFEKKPLLPVSPNAYLGIVIHKILELISKGCITSEDDLSIKFDEQVRIQEEALNKQGYNYFVPLQMNVKDFGLKKILLKRHLRNISRKSQVSSKVNYYSEKWFESKDKLIAGKIDLIIEEEQEIEIIDFKTGAITQDVLDDDGEIISDIKEEYKEQLKLYAYLFFETSGKFPTKLSLIDLAKQRFTIDFEQSECYNLFEEAKKLLHFTNNSINTGEFAANPSEINCKYCLYRPACSFFLKKIEWDYSYNDISGAVKNVVKYMNGNVSAFLENNDNQITVTSFPEDKYEELNSRRNKRISIFNLRKEATKFVYSATKTTIIYE